MIGYVEPVSKLFCLLENKASIRVATEPEFQNEVETEFTAHDDVIGYVEPVSRPNWVVGAHDADIAFNAQDAVIGRVDPVAISSCLLENRVSIRVATEELFQYDAEIAFKAHEEVTGRREPVAILNCLLFNSDATLEEFQ